MFACHGAVAASWLVRIPDVQAGLGLRESTLGLVLAALSAGVVGALPPAGGAVARVGSRPVTMAGASLCVVALPALAVAGSAVGLAACLVALGIGLSAMDVGMNSQGIGVEGGYGRSILVGFHAAWSLGSLGGAGAGALAVAARVPVPVHLGIVAGLVAGIVVVARPWLRVRDRVGRTRGDDRRAGALALPRGAVVPIAVVALAAALGENATMDWSGVYLRDVVGVPAGHVGWAFVAFSTAMALTRLLGDRVTDRVGAPRAVAGGARLAAAGLVLVVLVPTVPTALVGFFAVGVGVAVTIPLAFAAAGRVGPSAGTGVAAVATVAYSGFVLAPPVIGIVADHLDLRVSLLLIAVAVTALGGRTGTFPERSHGR